ncbi:hypothetical protein A9Q96_15065 [Rhodobacterales bacterium 52_120_T64]|nr:hypothetical protein A9Q96_15065 [Rhodobacterales bacterium 52_120_T64]
MQNINQKHSATSRFTRLIRNFSDDSGATTVEFVLWVPVFMFILMITVDVSLLFLRQSNLWYVARDGARQASLRIITDDAGLQDYVETQGTFGGDRPSATDTDPDTTDTHIDTQLDTVTVVLRVPMADVGIFGILRFGSRAISIGKSGDLVAFVTMRLEPI